METIDQALVMPARVPTLDQPLALGVMASGSGSNFEALATAIARGDLNAEIRLLICNRPEAAAVARAERLGIPVQVLDHRQHPSREDLDRAIVAAFRAAGVEWVAMAGWMRIITQVLLDAFPERLVNIHPSLLPSFKGIRAVEQALAAGVTLAGCTVHIVTLEMDSGPILIQAAVPVLPGDTAASLHARIQVQEHRIFPRAIALAAAREAAN